MAPLFTSDEIFEATGARAKDAALTSINSISIDSRELGSDALFVAIKGDRFDGHDFVETALTNGAVAALVSEGKAAGGRCIIVPDALAGLRDLARLARQRSSACVVAVTGSVGKTTTKEAIRTIFEFVGLTHASIRSFNNHWGVPLMLARMPAETLYGVFELGMSAAGEIEPLSRLVRPNIAVITTIAPAHLEAFESIEGIAAAKAEIFLGLEPNGTALLNADHEQIDLLIAAAKAAGVVNIVTYGFSENSDWQVVNLVTEGDQSKATVRHGENRFELAINVPGRHMVANGVAALAVSDLAGVDRDRAIAALAGFGAPVGRGQRMQLGEVGNPLLLIDESYNANTASMNAALEVLAQTTAPGGHKVAILGDMLELGPNSATLHASLKEAVLASGADRIYLVGDEMLALASELGANRVRLHVKTAAQLAEVILDELAYGDAVMVKGSNDVRLAGIVDAIRERFK
ncbi:UDP-N-acetylmuramoyl-tripeptide--D-alanyl-D-alanine ligase [Devosia rhodophyticola]|uniref:UDP-N-acetylmuramoyl-tripeptide--D-alanyl-D-alanine ligase n=1 Tax=Devosia rhodophyticola TaxID=3026423 RepID=A0ABY7YVQ3_9HYPH|nr:UDP-N-acetylmuramoyl-tripeptide--D-alanyl-D-alanine ligase [Devosia rhodophyticola]WDR05326.1 UDP-N-acetylmuramoyl-tripeptide--D-alanyl-D-alanine ligase [Devosia rhodophyticola]